MAECGEDIEILKLVLVNFVFHVLKLFIKKHYSKIKHQTFSFENCSLFYDSTLHGGSTSSKRMKRKKKFKEDEFQKKTTWRAKSGRWTSIPQSTTRWSGSTSSSTLQGLAINRSQLSTFKIEVTIPEIDGEQGMNINFWILNFEQIAESYHFTETQKFVFARNKLQGIVNYCDLKCFLKTIPPLMFTKN